jgi:hypothetical protein
MRKPMQAMGVRRRGFVGSLLALGIATPGALVGIAACGSHAPTTAGAAPLAVNGVYAVQIQSTSPSSLPACNSKTAGETAIVTSTHTLESCVSGVWVPVPCLIGGAVAFDSAADSLWACTQGSSGGPPGWSQITLPQGAPGATGATGAQGPEGDSGAQSLVLQVPELPGPNCPHGGTKIESGLDVNRDGQLETAEVASTSYVCDGANGDAGAPGSLVTVTAEPEGVHCPAGGQRIDIGIDTNGDGLLEANEIQHTAYVCSGAPAAFADGGSEQDASTGAGGSSNSPDASDGSTVATGPFCTVSASNEGAVKLTYWGGPVVSNAAVVLVNWNAAVQPTEVEAAPAMLAKMASIYSDVLAQYRSPTQNIGPGSFIESVIIPGGVTTPTLDEGELAQTLAADVASGVLPAPQLDSQGHSNTVFMIQFPPGLTLTLDGEKSCVNFCGYHSDVVINGVHVPFAAIPDFSVGSGCDSGCGSIWHTESAELVDMITDPEVNDASGIGPPLAWFDTTNGEIADICQDAVPSDFAAIWSNTQKACVQPCDQ